MLYTYPSNRLENLVSALDTLLQASTAPVLAADVILVQHPGMQHWLSMELAKLPSRQICMNAVYPLPVRYFWDLIRLILGPERIPERSVYSREILAWRIYALLQTPALAEDPLMAEPTQYWQDQPATLRDSRRFQLSEQLADLYEQYLMFRPEWIELWETGDTPHWQAKLWQALVAQNPDHPLALMRAALAAIQSPALRLPATFYIFGINALAPLWLDFLSQIASQAEVDIHLLYLNPSVEYWDELRSEKQLSKDRVRTAQTRANWVLEQQDAERTRPPDVGNPLLASLGHQGQTFVRLLSDKAHYDLQVFSPVARGSFLGQLQDDILTLKDARPIPPAVPEPPADASICITSAHSAFREVQALHDWLLHQFNEDPSLTPKDVVVMCPNVEDYAPFVQAVFARSFAKLKDSVPPLPCSIADRNLKDADPTVAAFLELLTLPDARFEVNQILAWLRVPAIAAKFALSANDIQTISQWLEHANIHWGLNGEHKQQWVAGAAVSDHFTWQQGLDRLLLGFAYSDESLYVHDRVLLPDVEGSAGLLLGKLTQIIGQLRNVRSNLVAARTPSQWQAYLIEQIQIALLSSDPLFERSNQALLKAINDVTEYANQAGLHDEAIPLTVMRAVLEKAFASPEQTGSQFMTGQITVCSMVPMRSIPFRIVAILGLNDGQFPRTRPPLGFDLMAQDSVRLGDRSRRGDDRYLFLEALLSARDAVYLSYQGYDIHKNEQRPPSLVLDELLNYLHLGYGFDPEQDLRRMALQPFSRKNYQGALPSFDGHWATLLQARPAPASGHQVPPLAELKHQWRLDEWVRFFSHPAQYFAQQRLGLYLQQDRDSGLDDSEPFAMNHLDRYTIQLESIQQSIQAPLEPSAAVDLLTYRRAASALPMHDLVPEQLAQWQDQAADFSRHLLAHGAQTLTRSHRVLELAGHTPALELTADLPLTAEHRLLFWRPATIKGKDLITLWLHHLFANASGEPCHSHAIFRGDKKDTLVLLSCAPVAQARAQLDAFYAVLQQGLQQPLFLNADLALACLLGKDDAKAYATSWQDGYNQRGYCYDPYIAQFWASAPDYETTLAAVQNCYGALIAGIEITPLSEAEHE
jgi:exodeoxyribonuclease V gamma subunit